MWIKAFTETYVQSRNTVKKKIEKIAKEYYSKVYNPAHRNIKKNTKDVVEIHSLRSLNKRWRLENDCLFDISHNSNLLDGNELLFFQDQQTTRLARLSEEIDREYEEKRLEDYVELLQEQKLNEEQLNYIYADEGLQEDNDGSPDVEFLDFLWLSNRLKMMQI